MYSLDIWREWAWWVVKVVFAALAIYILMSMAATIRRSVEQCGADATAPKAEVMEQLLGDIEEH